MSNLGRPTHSATLAKPEVAVAPKPAAKVVESPGRTIGVGTPRATGASAVKSYGAMETYDFLVADHKKTLHMEGWAGRPLVARVVVEGDRYGKEGRKSWGEPGTPTALPGIIKPGITFFDASAPIESTTPFGEDMGGGIYVEGLLRSDAPCVGLVIERGDRSWKVPAAEVRKALRFAIETCDKVVEGWRDHIPQDVIDLKVGVPSFDAVGSMSDEALIHAIQTYGNVTSEDMTALAAVDRMLREAQDRELYLESHLRFSPVKVPPARFTPEGWALDIENNDAFRGLRLDAGLPGECHFAYLTIARESTTTDEAHGTAVAAIHTPTGRALDDLYYFGPAIACEKASRKAVERIRGLLEAGADLKTINDHMAAHLRQQGWECSRDWPEPTSKAVK